MIKRYGIFEIGLKHAESLLWNSEAYLKSLKPIIDWFQTARLSYVILNYDRLGFDAADFRQNSRSGRCQVALVFHIFVCSLSHHGLTEPMSKHTKVQYFRPCSTEETTPDWSLSTRRRTSRTLRKCWRRDLESHRWSGEGTCSEWMTSSGRLDAPIRLEELVSFAVSRWEEMGRWVGRKWYSLFWCFEKTTVSQEYLFLKQEEEEQLVSCLCISIVSIPKLLQSCNTWDLD